jgi:hypothetical protein
MSSSARSPLVIDPSESPLFLEDVSLEQPFGIAGNAYFTKILYKKRPLYIQTKKSLTKQGFTRSGKKLVCDLMFETTETAYLIQWFEQLEQQCQKCVYENKNGWFENADVIDQEDIENAFHSTIKLYKSGRYFLLHTTVKNNHKNEPTVKIYNEEQVPLSIEELTVDSEVLTVLEIQGIRFASKIFQIDIEMKQVMVIQKDPFDSFLIHSSNRKGTTQEVQRHDKEEEQGKEQEEQGKEQEQAQRQEVQKKEHEEQKKEQEEQAQEVQAQEEQAQEQVEDLAEKGQIVLEPYDPELELEPFDPPSPIGLGTIEVKKSRDIYKSMYQNLKEKARDQKEILRGLLLEAKKIKKTLQEGGNSEEDDNEYSSDLDDEIEEAI